MRNGLAWVSNLWGKKRASEVRAAWEAVFDVNNPAVGIVLKDLAHYCNMYKTSFVPSSLEATAFNEGARDVFLHIVEMLSLSPEEVAKFLNLPG